MASSAPSLRRRVAGVVIDGVQGGKIFFPRRSGSVAGAAGAGGSGSVPGAARAGRSGAFAGAACACRSGSFAGAARAGRSGSFAGAAGAVGRVIYMNRVGNRRHFSGSTNGGLSREMHLLVEDRLRKIYACGKIRVVNYCAGKTVWEIAYVVPYKFHSTYMFVKDYYPLVMFGVTGYSLNLNFKEYKALIEMYHEEESQVLKGQIHDYLSRKDGTAGNLEEQQKSGAIVIMFSRHASKLESLDQREKLAAAEAAKRAVEQVLLKIPGADGKTTPGADGKATPPGADGKTTPGADGKATPPGADGKTTPGADGKTTPP